MTEKTILQDEKLSVAKILCPVDFSEFSERALRYATIVAGHFGAKLYVQHTVAPPTILDSLAASANAPAEHVEREKKHAQAKLFELFKTTGLHMHDVHLILNDGNVEDSIHETIVQQEIDLLIIGTHGHKGLIHLVLGSEAETIVHKAGCPVLVVCRPETDLSDPVRSAAAGWQSIMVATDFSRHSERALAYALQWASSWRSRLLVFHTVQETSPDLKDAVDLLPEYNASFEKHMANAWSIIREIVPEAEHPTCEVSFEVRQGHAKDEILRLAKERGTDLIIMGTRDSGNIGSHWDSVSSAVARDGRFPVLILREFTTRL